MKSLTCLHEFRNRAYCILGNGRDGLFDLMDATMTTRSVPSFAELSLSPVFRRQWSSLYKVLERSELPSETLMKLYVEHLPQPPQNTQIVLAGDHTAWSRLWSPTLQERTYEHQPQNRPGAGPVTVGQGYSTMVCLPEMQGTWALPNKRPCGAL